MTNTRQALLLLMLLSLAGCGTPLIKDKKIDYQKSTTVPSLEVPPELNLQREEELRVPGERSVNYSDYDEERAPRREADKPAPAAASTVIPPPPEGMKLQRQGKLRWLTVTRSPEAVWPQIRQFWQNVGFEFARDEPKVGILETNWAENRANIKDDLLRRTLGRLIDFAYSSSTRDMYRTRLEHGIQSGTVEIHITHKGMHEVEQGDNFVWVPRPSEPDLEAEMLKRLMIYLGGDQQSAERQVAAPEELEQIQAKLVEAAGTWAIELPTGFAEAWRRTGQALDHGGFTLEDLNRSKGEYYVRYIGKDKQEAGFLERLAFWRDDKDQKQVYVLHVSRDSTPSRITLSRQDGETVEKKRVERILKILLEHF